MYLQDALRDVALTQAEIYVLGHLAAEGPSTVGEIHGTFGHRPSTLTSVLDRLEARGLVARSVNPADRRSVVVTPTATGAIVADRVRGIVEDLERRVVEVTSPADQGGFLALLNAIEHATEGQDPIVHRPVTHHRAPTTRPGRPRVPSRVEAALLAYKAGVNPGESEPPRG